MPNIVKDRSVLRQLIHVGTEISDSAFNTEGRETAELLEHAERQFSKSLNNGNTIKAALCRSNPLLAQAVDKIEIMFGQEGSITGASTGFTDFDDLTSGLQPVGLDYCCRSDLRWVKPRLSMNMAENIAIKSRQTRGRYSVWKCQAMRWRCG